MIALPQIDSRPDHAEHDTQTEWLLCRECNPSKSAVVSDRVGAGDTIRRALECAMHSHEADRRSPPYPKPLTREENIAYGCKPCAADAALDVLLAERQQQADFRDAVTDWLDKSHKEELWERLLVLLGPEWEGVTNPGADLIKAHDEVQQYREALEAAKEYVEAEQQDDRLVKMLVERPDHDGSIQAAQRLTRANADAAFAALVSALAVAGEPMPPVCCPEAHGEDFCPVHGPAPAAVAGEPSQERETPRRASEEISAAGWDDLAKAAGSAAVGEPAPPPAPTIAVETFPKPGPFGWEITCGPVPPAASGEKT